MVQDTCRTNIRRTEFNDKILMCAVHYFSLFPRCSSNEMNRKKLIGGDTDHSVHAMCRGTCRHRTPPAAPGTKTWSSSLPVQPDCRLCQRLSPCHPDGTNAQITVCLDVMKQVFWASIRCWTGLHSSESSHTCGELESCSHLPEKLAYGKPKDIYMYCMQ